MAASIFPFLTDAQFDQLVANGLTARAQADFDPLSVVKLFTPDAGATRLLSEIDLEDPDIAFTLCDLGMGFAELGCVSLAELAGLARHAGAADRARPSHGRLLRVRRADRTAVSRQRGGGTRSPAHSLQVPEMPALEGAAIPLPDRGLSTHGPAHVGTLAPNTSHHS